MLKDEDKTKEQLINELKELRSRIGQSKEVVVDRLTGLYNRRHFLDLAEYEFARTRRLERHLSAIMLDIDHLKQINDTYGQSIGDQVLAVVAKRCRTNVRFVDIPGRYGGGKFVLMLPEANLPAANQVAERLRQCVAKTPISTERGLIKITISLGVTSLTVDAPNLSDLLERSDKAMHLAKQGGRNRVEVG